MEIFAFTPFLLVPWLRDWAGGQAVFAASVLLATVAFQISLRQLKIPLQLLPWLIWPLFLLARTPAQMEFFSETGLRIITMLFAAILVLGEAWNEKRAAKSALISALCILLVQAYGVVVQAMPWGLSSVFSQENSLQFVNLGIIALAVWMASLGEFSKPWRVLALFVAVGALLSFITGDGFITSDWGLSSGDSIGSMLGLCFGLTFTGMLWFWRRVGGSHKLVVGLAIALVLLWAVLPLIFLQLSIWKASQPSSVTSRITMWQATWNMIHAHPCFGVGVGNYGSVIQEYWPSLKNALFPFFAFPIVAHHHHLHVWAETGVFGFIWSVFLYGAPWVWAVRRYLDNGRKVDLAWVALLGAMQCAMTVLEVSQMFFVPQMLLWIVTLVASVKMLPSSRCFTVRAIWVYMFVPFVILMVWDRSMQIRSQILTAKCEITGKVTESDLPAINESMHIHTRNSAALYYIGELKRMNGEYISALQAVDALEEISGSRWPVHRMRAEIYHEMGNEEMACQEAKRPIAYSLQKRDQDLRNLLHCK